MILIVEAYRPQDESRLAEIESCVKANGDLGIFKEFQPMQSDTGRLRYGQVFRTCAERYPGRVCVLANADIVFDESAKLLPYLVRKGRLVTLTRWENDSTPRMLGQYRDGRFYSGSQDVWAFIGGELVGLGDRTALGYIGCDQAIAGEAMNAGIEVVNPALSIKTKHVHTVGGVRGPDELSCCGTYAYPELTTTRCTGSVVYHEWPKETHEG